MSQQPHHKNIALRIIQEDIRNGLIWGNIPSQHNGQESSYKHTQSDSTSEEKIGELIFFVEFILLWYII